MVRKRIGVSSVDTQNDHQEGFFFNRLITDFEPMALRFSGSWRRRRARPKHERAWYLKCKKLIFKETQSNFQQGKLSLNEKQWNRGEREASTKDFACSSVENI